MKTGYYISPKDYNTIINYARAAYDEHKCEIGGMSVCYQDEDGDWVIMFSLPLHQSRILQLLIMLIRKESPMSA